MFNIRKIFIHIFWLVLLGTLWPANTSTVEQPVVLKAGEDLFYKVKWSFLRVGSLRLVNEGVQEYQGKSLFKLKVTIDSSPGLPFITIHDVYECLVDSLQKPYYFVAYEKKGDHTIVTEYFFDYELETVRSTIRLEYADRTEWVEDKTVKIDQVYRDVLSLLFYARVLSGQIFTGMKVPMFVLSQTDSCFFDEGGTIQEVKVQGKKIPAFYLKGKVKFIGIAGIKDDFQGWFSLDEARVPLKAKMKAFFGSITIELEEAHNWSGQQTHYPDLKFAGNVE